MTNVNSFVVQVVYYHNDAVIQSCRSAFENVYKTRKWFKDFLLDLLNLQFFFLKEAFYNITKYLQVTLLIKMEDLKINVEMTVKYTFQIRKKD